MTGTKLSRRRVASMLGAMAVAGSTAWLTVGGAVSVRAQTTTTTTAGNATTTTAVNTTVTDPPDTTTTVRSGSTTSTTRSSSGSTTTSTIAVGGPATAVAGQATFTG